MIALPDDILTLTGPLKAIERPMQGTNFQVLILSGTCGRFVLKFGNTPAKITELAQESAVLNQLRAKQPLVAQPVGHVLQADQGLFLFSCIEGENMLDALERADNAGRHQLVAEFARTLRHIHNWQPEFARPKDWLSEALRRAAHNVAAGLIENPLQRDSRFAGVDPAVLLAELLQRRTEFENDLVFGHGDYCLPNVLVRDNTIVGVIDWSWGGYADQRFDLATALWTIEHNLRSPDYAATFLQAYGYRRPLADLGYFRALYRLL